MRQTIRSFRVGKAKCHSEDVDTVAEECNSDQQYLSQSTHVCEAIIRQACKPSLQRTTTDSGKSHDVARPRRTEIFNQVKWGGSCGRCGLLATSAAAIRMSAVEEVVWSSIEIVTSAGL